MKLLIQTQDYENYAWSEDGSLMVGDEAYWKAKGGTDYVLDVDGFKHDSEFAEKNTEILVDAIRDRIECSGDAFQSFIIGYEWVADDYLTWFEQSQLDLDGEITCPAVRMEYEQFKEGAYV